MEVQREGEDWLLLRKVGPYEIRWLHSNIKNMALSYVFNTYDKMLKLGELTEWKLNVF